MLALESMRYAGSLTSEGTDVSLDIQANADGDCTAPSTWPAARWRSWRPAATAGSAPTRPSGRPTRRTRRPRSSSPPSGTSGSWTAAKSSPSSATSTSSGTACSTRAAARRRTPTRAADEIDGEAVVEVETEDEQGTSSGFVLVEGEHYLVRIVSADADERRRGDVQRVRRGGRGRGAGRGRGHRPQPGRLRSSSTPACGGRVTTSSARSTPDSVSKSSWASLDRPGPRPVAEVDEHQQVAPVHRERPRLLVDLAAGPGEGWVGEVRVLLDGAGPGVGRSRASGLPARTPAPTSRAGSSR